MPRYMHTTIRALALAVSISEGFLNRRGAAGLPWLGRHSQFRDEVTGARENRSIDQCKFVRGHMESSSTRASDSSAVGNSLFILTTSRRASDPLGRVRGVESVLAARAEKTWKPALDGGGDCRHVGP